MGLKQNHTRTQYIVSETKAAHFTEPLLFLANVIRPKIKFVWHCIPHWKNIQVVDVFVVTYTIIYKLLGVGPQITQVRHHATRDAIQIHLARQCCCRLSLRVLCGQPSTYTNSFQLPLSRYWYTTRLLDFCWRVSKLRMFPVLGKFFVGTDDDSQSLASLTKTKIMENDRMNVVPDEREMS